MTLWAAIANFHEDDVGSIEVGKWADLVVMDRNLLTVDPDQILEAKTLRTFVSGIQVYHSSN